MTAFVDFDDVWLAYNDELLAAGAVRGRGHHAAGRARRVHRHRRPVGLRQVDLHEAGHRAEDAVSKGTHPHRRPAGDRAAEDHRHGVPGAEPAAVAHDARQRAAAAGDRRAVPLSFKRQRARVRSARRATLLQSVGLGGYEDKFPWQLSGGMQQRASRSAARWSTSRRCCCSTSRSARSTRSRARSCGARCATCWRRSAST